MRQEDVHLLLGVAGGEREAAIVGEYLGSSGVAVAFGDDVQLASHEIAAAFLVREDGIQRIDTA